MLARYNLIKNLHLTGNDGIQQFFASKVRYHIFMKQKVDENEWIVKGVRVDPDFLKQLESAVREAWPNAEMEIVTICDNAKLIFESLDNFLENSDCIQKAIDEIDIHISRPQTVNDGLYGKISLSFCCKSGEPAIKEDLSVEDIKDYNTLHDNLKAIFKEYRLIYGSLSSFPLFIFLALVLAMMFTFWLLDAPRQVSKSFIFEIYILLFAIGCLSASSKVGKAKSYLFPKNELYFGCNKRRIDNSAKIRNFILTGVIGTIIIGVIVNVISNWIL